MKKNIYLLSFLVLSLFTNCDKNDDTNNESQLNNGNIEVTTDI